MKCVTKLKKISWMEINIIFKGYFGIKHLIDTEKMNSLKLFHVEFPGIIA